MRGFHLTPARNLGSILDIGLQPYVMEKHYLPTGTKGIWTWAKRPAGESLLGCIIQRVIDHHVWQVVLLSYEFDIADCYPDEEGLWTIHHDGMFYGNEPHEPWSYHRDELAYILTVPVPPDSIRVEREFNVERIITG